MSRGTGAARGRGPSESIGSPEPDREHRRAVATESRRPSSAEPNAVAGRSRAARISFLDSRTAVRDSDGAAIRTRCPRSASSAATLPANSLTSWRASQGYGETWAIERGSAATAAG